MKSDSEFLKFKKILPAIKENVRLENYTTFKIGGPAKYFFEARSKEDLVKAVRACKKLKLPFFILGWGSNVLVSDKGFKGLVIRALNANFEIRNLDLYSEGGTPVNLLVKETTSRGLSGLEWAGGLPGTLGGAVRGNAGAFKGEIKDIVVWVEVLDKSLKVRKLSRQQCQFGYRSSIFKKRSWTVLSVLMKLKKGDKKKLKAEALSYIKFRQERGPLEYPNAGSVFKNCRLDKASRETAEIFKDVVKVDPFPVIPTAAVIARAGLKGFRVGDMQVSEKHPNFIVNLGQGKAEDVKKLIKSVKQKIKKKYGLELQEEIQYL